MKLQPKSTRKATAAVACRAAPTAPTNCARVPGARASRDGTGVRVLTCGLSSSNAILPPGLRQGLVVKPFAARRAVARSNADKFALKTPKAPHVKKGREPSGPRVAPPGPMRDNERPRRLSHTSARLRPDWIPRFSRYAAASTEVRAPRPHSRADASHTMWAATAPRVAHSVELRPSEYRGAQQASEAGDPPPAPG